MPSYTHDLDLAGLRLSAGEGRRFTLAVRIEPFVLAAETYTPEPAPTPVVVEISRLVGGGYALRLLFSASISGPCMRCLKEAHPGVEVEAREVMRPGEGEELSSPYVQEETLDLATWAHDALALALPSQILCSEDCAGLCSICAADLNEVGPEHHHETPRDHRWAKLDELRRR